MISTWLTERFGLDVPVVSAPMAGVSGGALAAAVSSAGGLGMIGFGAASADDVARETALAAASGRPYGVGLIAWTLEGQPHLLDAVLAARPALVSVCFGDWQHTVGAVHDAGAVFAVQVGTVAEARAARDAGADVVVARGGEGGGHGRNLVATLPLLQGVLDAVDGPVLAAGGIATPRGLAAVLAAGAAGAWVGTAFLGCVEGLNKPTARQAVVAAAETDTIYTTVLDLGRGIPWPEEFGGRAIRNTFATTWHGREDELRAAGTRSEESVVWAGHAVGLVDAERSAAAVVADLATAEELLRAAARRVT